MLVGVGPILVNTGKKRPRSPTVGPNRAKGSERTSNRSCTNLATKLSQARTNSFESGPHRIAYTPNLLEPNRPNLAALTKLKTKGSIQGRANKLKICQMSARQPRICRHADFDVQADAGTDASQSCCKLHGMGRRDARTDGCAAAGRLLHPCGTPAVMHPYTPNPSTAVSRRGASMEMEP